jgi:hypothetical protein
MSGDRIYYTLYIKPTPEIKRMHIREIIEEANRNFTLASKREETITLKRLGQRRLIDLI